MAKPDNRANNEERLQENIDNTKENFREAQDYLAEHAEEISGDEKQSIENKNRRRKESVSGFISEKKDEAQH